MPLPLQSHGMSRTWREAEAQQQRGHGAAQPAAPATTDAAPAALGQLPPAAPLQPSGSAETELGPGTAPTVTHRDCHCRDSHRGTATAGDTATGREMPAKSLS